jgi:hypothetical protein
MSEWLTYTPDGRSLTVRRGDGEMWTVACGESGAVEAPSLHEAITRALAESEPVSLHSSRSKLDEWIGARCRQIEAEWRAGSEPGS